MILKFTTILFTLLFLGAMFGSLFYMTMDMKTTGAMSGCPFVSSGETLCSMSASEHIESWQSMFLTVTPGFSLFLLVLSTVLVLLFAPNLLVKQTYRSPIIFKVLVERVYTFSYRSLQEMFSNGILHPKLF